MNTNEATIDSARLSEEELQQITGYSAPLRQLNVLHMRGFVRAYRARDGRVILERPHYLAVCRGEFSNDRGQPQPSVNIAFLKRA
ncbi:DUF4224 domain-containing protein [Limnohabitans sp.]|jgi:hypothetical protein|uniref:DUF4224 domain-containing protein n=1 Tax=Limnohabitans sp. TaxID=1907725 RepID=UPI00286F9E60|nr:DUF4224 domain-containing protein [Limnohabitans sp.]